MKVCLLAAALFLPAICSAATASGKVKDAHTKVVLAGLEVSIIYPSVQRCSFL
jgi:hypothetical protein